MPLSSCSVFLWSVRAIESFRGEPITPEFHHRGIPIVQPVAFGRRYHFSGKRSAAAASLLGIRVLEREALVHQGFFVVENHAVQVDERLRIDKDANIFELKDAIAFARLRVETDVVTQSRTTTTLHTQTQSALGWRDVFLRHRQ